MPFLLCQSVTSSIRADSFCVLRPFSSTAGRPGSTVMMLQQGIRAKSGCGRPCLATARSPCRPTLRRPSTLAQAAEAPQAEAAAAATTLPSEPAPSPTSSSSGAPAARPPRSSSQWPAAYGRVAGTLLRQAPVRVAGSADRTKLAAFLVRLFESEPGQTVLLTAVGGEAITVALSAAAKLQDMLPEWPALEGRQVTWRASLLTRALSFGPKEEEAPAAGAAEAGGDDSEAATGAEGAAAATSEAAAGGRKLFGLFVSLRPAEQFASTEEQATASAPMKLRFRGARRTDGEQQEEQQQDKDERLQDSREQQRRITAHIVRNISTGRPALLELQSPGLPLKSKILLGLLVSASKQLSRDKSGFRFSCTQSRELFETPPPSSAAAAADGAAAESSSGDDDVRQPQPAGAAEPRAWSKQVRIVVTCHPSPVPGRQDEGAGDDKGAAASGGERRSGRPARRVREARDGMVEVPLEEWAQLKEQLEVVPALTEQLQIMTRQHEQLLSLLAQQQQ